MELVECKHCYDLVHTFCSRNVNPFQPSIVFHIEISTGFYIKCNAGRKWVTGFYIKCNTGRKWVTGFYIKCNTGRKWVKSLRV